MRARSLCVNRSLTQNVFWTSSWTSCAPWATSSLAQRKAASRAQRAGSRSACPRSTSWSRYSSKAWASASSSAAFAVVALTAQRAGLSRGMSPVARGVADRRRDAAPIGAAVDWNARDRRPFAACAPRAAAGAAAIPLALSRYPDRHPGHPPPDRRRRADPRMSSFSTAGPTRTTSCIASSVTRERWSSAHPSYWASRGIPAHPRELDRHTCVLVRNPAGIVIDLWEFERGAERASVKVNGWLCSTGREVVLDACWRAKGSRASTT